MWGLLIDSIGGVVHIKVKLKRLDLESSGIRRLRGVRPGKEGIWDMGLEL